MIQQRSNARHPQTDQPSGKYREPQQHRQPQQPAQLRLTRRGCNLLIAVVLAALAPLLGVGAKAVASEPPQPDQVSVYTVAPGDTLWQLAESIADDGDDLRDVVRDLQLLNNLPSTALSSGQVLLLPVTQ